MKTINVFISGDADTFSTLDGPKEFLTDLYKDDDVYLNFLMRGEYEDVDDAFIEEIDVAFYYPHEFIDPFEELNIDSKHRGEIEGLRDGDCLLLAINDIKGAEEEKYHITSLHENSEEAIIKLGNHDTINWKAFIDKELGIYKIGVKRPEPDNAGIDLEDNDLMLLL